MNPVLHAFSLGFWVAGALPVPFPTLAGGENRVGLSLASTEAT